MKLAYTQNGCSQEREGFSLSQGREGEAAMLERIKEDTGMLEISKKEKIFAQQM